MTVTIRADDLEELLRIARHEGYTDDDFVVRPTAALAARLDWDKPWEGFAIPLE